jgi:O-antigen/teichoic acid export membrane protein
VEAPQALGVYRIAVMVAELLWLIPDAVNIPLFNRISRTEKVKDSVSVITQSHRILTAVVSLLSVAMFVVGWWGIPLVLGQEYIDARWLLGLLIPGAVALVTSRLLGTFFNARGYPEKTSLIQVIGAVASVIGYLTLIPPFGVAGAAIATSLSYAIIALTASFMFVTAAKPYPISLFRPTRGDIRWAYSLVRDSLTIWREKIGGAR